MFYSSKHYSTMSIFRYPLGILLILGIAAHASVLWEHFSAMWDSNSFRFFPLAIVLALYVAYRRRGKLVPLIPDSESEATNSDKALEVEPVRSSLVVFGMVLSVIAALLTTIMSTPMLGWLSFLFFLCVLIYAGHGKQGLKALWPSLVLLGMVRFIPDSIDAYIAIGLQKFASSLASVLMDAIGWTNIREGAMLSLASSKFEALEACSGIRSLFSSLTVIFAWGILRNYGWVRHLFNLLQTFFWVLVFNAFRVSLVLVFESRGWVSIAQGIPLEIATTLIFLAIIAMALSTDQLITAFTLKEEPIDLGNANVLENPVVADSTWKWSLGGSAAVAWMIGLGAASLISLRMLMSVSTMVSATGISYTGSFPEPTKEVLDNQIEGWVVTDFSHIERFNKHLLGKDTYQWTLRKGKKTALLSLDQAAKRNENPQLHFSSLGWLSTLVESDTPTKVGEPVDEQKVTAVVDQENDKVNPKAESEESIVPNENEISGTYRQLALTRRGGESGVVMFTKLGRFGEPIPTSERTDMFSLDFWSQRFRDGIAILLGNKSAAQNSALGSEYPSQTLRLTCIPNVELKPEDLTDLKKLLVASEDMLRKSGLFESSK